MSIETARQDCIKAWESAPDATWAWCCHHSIRQEPLGEPFLNRINYITSTKPLEEQETRFNNFRPVLSHLPEFLLESGDAYVKAKDDYVKSNNALKFWNAEYAWSAYKEVACRNDPEITALHKLDVPYHTWNGASIF